jgi:hypothetical protein
MTIVNFSHKFIYVHIPKTAGTSLKEYFRAFEQAGDIHIQRQADAERAAANSHILLGKHSRAVQICQAIGEERFDSFFKFSLVRNPFDRTVSTFLFLKHNFRNWSNSAAMDKFESLEAFVRSGLFRRAGPSGIFEPQARWLLKPNGELSTDYVGRLETLESDVMNVLKALGLPMTGAPVPQQNRSHGIRSPLVSELSLGAVVDAIRLRYAVDFELFNYGLEPDDALAIADPGTA